MVIVTVIQLSTRGTVDSDHWYMHLVEQASGAKLPSVGLWLNASKSESMLKSNAPTLSVYVSPNKVFRLSTNLLSDKSLRAQYKKFTGSFTFLKDD